MKKRFVSFLCAAALMFGTVLPAKAEQGAFDQPETAEAVVNDASEPEIVPEPRSYTEKEIMCSSASFSLSWESPEEAEACDITSSDGKTVIEDYRDQTLKLSSSLLTDKYLEIYVKPYVLVGDEKNYLDGFKFCVYLVPGKASGKLSAEPAASSVTLSWSKVKNAENYYVYANDAVSGKRTFFGVTESTSLIYNAKEATSYNFEVVPSVYVNGRRLFSEYPLTAFASTQPKKVTNLKCSLSGAGTVDLSWDKTQCTKYQVFRKELTGYKLIGTASSETFSDKVSSGDGVCTYSVKAVYTDAQGNDRIGDMSDEVRKCVLSTPKMQAAISGLGAVRVRWNKVDGASCYRVFIYKNGAWQPYVTTKSLFYTFSGLDSKTTYLFHVKPCVTYEGKLYTAAGSSVKVVTDSLLKSRTAFTIYSKADASSSVLYRGSAYSIIQQKGITDVNGWYKVYVPGTSKAKVGYVKANQVAAYQNLGFSAINQNGWEGGAPMVMGCESAALATVLKNALGIYCSKNDIADHYTRWVRHGGGDPNYAFYGNPYVYTGNDGIYAPAIAQAAHWFLGDKGKRDKYSIAVHTDYYPSVNWKNLSLGNASKSMGLDLAGLKRELNKGHALVVWFTTYNAAPRVGGYYTVQKGTKLSNGGSGTYTFKWIAPQHCAVIKGFDDVTQRIIIADVINGSTVTYPYSTFMRGYNALGRQTVVIDKL